MGRERGEWGALSDIELFDVIIADEKVQGKRILPRITVKEYLEKRVHKIKWAKTVLEYGREFILPTEEQVRQMYDYWRAHEFPFKNGQCYRNSYVFGKSADWAYVEGLAMTIPERTLFHAWNSVPDSSVVADVTWPLFSYFANYMGIEFPVGFVSSLWIEEKKRRKKSGGEPCFMGGILYSWFLFEEPVKEFLRTRRDNSPT